MREQKMHVNIYLPICMGLLIFAMVSRSEAQFIESPDDINVDELKTLDDPFNDHYFNAITYKSIDNNEQAISELQECLSINPNEFYVYNELGKNYFRLERYKDAEINFVKAMQMAPDNMDIAENVYDIYLKQKKYKEAIPVVQILAKTDGKFRNDLANLYALTKQHEKALAVLDELDGQYGNSPFRESIRNRILESQYKNAKNPVEERKKQLRTAISQFPNKEKNYIELSTVYLEENDAVEAQKTVDQLLDVKPDSDSAHIILYQLALESGDFETSVKSIIRILKNNRISSEHKHKALKDMLMYVKKNPRFERRLNELTELFVEDSGNEKLYIILGKYFAENQQWDEALVYFDKVTKKNPNNFDILKTKLLIQIKSDKYAEVEQISEVAIENFPSQPLLYLLNGIANLHLGKPNIALESLNNGIDYVIDDAQMESDFYLQMAKAYTALGEHGKANTYKSKADEVKPGSKTSQL